jgi:hypothetical protein
MKSFFFVGHSLIIGVNIPTYNLKFLSDLNLYQWGFPVRVENIALDISGSESSSGLSLEYSEFSGFTGLCINKTFSDTFFFY